jgi:N-acetylmuramoyl-L-alanine amidase
VLARTSMPGVLVETGFISNPHEEKFLMTDHGQDLIASAIYRAFKQYKHRIEENSKFTQEPVIAENTGAEWESKANMTGNTADYGLEDHDQPQEDDRITFLVQIASTKNRIDPEPSGFKGYQNITVIEHGKWYKYAVGNNLSYHEALEKCTQVKNDFPDAFVIAVRNNELVPLSEAIVEINK